MKTVKFLSSIFSCVISLVLVGCGGGSPGENKLPASSALPDDVHVPVQFGDVPMGFRRSNTVSVWGLGLKGMNVRALPALPAPFSIVQDNCSSRTIPSGISCTFDIQFTPTATGSFRHSFDIPTDSSNKITVSMIGQGVASSGSGDDLSPVTWTGTKQFGTASDDKSWSVAVDADGNVYVAGETWGGLNYAGGGDAFVVKYNAAGLAQWNLQFGTVALDRAFGVVVDTAGNVYVCGQTYGGLDGDTFKGGDGDAFVVKYNAAGVRQWTKQIGTTGGDSANGVAVDINGNLYVAGGVGGRLSGNVYAGGDADAFMAKYDALGEEQWLQQFGAGGRDIISSVAVDADGNAHVAGEASGSLHGSPYVGGFSDAFVAKYDATGTWLWTRIFGAQLGVFGTSNTDAARSVAVDTHGHVYVGGWTTGALDGDTTASNHGLGSMGDGFVIQFDTTGTQQWIRQLGGGGTDAVYGVAVDALGSVYLVGQAGSGLGGNRSAGGDDAFVMKYDAAGTRLWTRQPGTILGDYAYGVAVSVTGNVFAAGTTLHDLNGNTNIGGYNFDAFVVKYEANGGG